MRKLIIISLSLFLMAGAQAQCIRNNQVQSARFQDNWQKVYSKYNGIYYGMYSLMYYGGHSIDKNVKSKEILNYSFKKGVKSVSPKSREITSFSEGLITNNKYYHKGKLKRQFGFEYNKDGYFTLYYLGDPNHPKKESQLTYNDSNRVVQYLLFNKKHQIKKKETMKYNDRQQLTQKSIYYKGKMEPKYIWNYKYDEEGRRIETTYYKNGKLKSRWKFTCDDEGKKVDPKNVKQTTTCSLVEHNNDGSYVKIYRYTDSKGRQKKYRWTYNKDSLLVMYERVNHKGKIIGKYVNEYDSLKNRISYTYYKKGGEKIYRIRRYVYNDQKEVVQSSIYDGNGKMKSKKTYAYDSDGRNTQYVEYNSKNQIKWKADYVYNDKGEMISQLYYKKDMPYNQQEVVFHY